MIKRVNFTGRRRIARDRVTIAVRNGPPRTFDAVIDLDGLVFPPGAAIRLEAMCAGSSVIEPFDCGTVDAVRAMTDRALTKIEGENVFFALKVIDRTERIGRLLGMAENIRPEMAGEQKVARRRGILPIQKADLKQELWRLDCDGHDLCLLVNENVPNLYDRVRWDPTIYAMIYPAVIRQLLSRAIDAGVEVDEDSDRWQVLWLRFGKSLHPERQDPPGADATEERDDWIDEVVDAFCDLHLLKEKYNMEASLGNGGDS